MREKFSIAEVEMLRRDMRQSSWDSFQSAQMISAFVAGRGYGISKESAWGVARRLDGADENLEFLHRQLESLAQMM